MQAKTKTKAKPDPANLRLIAGVGDGTETACLMSARAVLDGRGVTDDHPSAVLRNLGIRINDGRWWRSNAERTAILLPLALDERLCASKCIVTAETEKERARLCINWALRVATPSAMRSAASALRLAKLPEHADKLAAHARALEENPSRDGAIVARDDAYEARSAAATAAYAAAAADAAAAAAAADAADAADAARRAADPWPEKLRLRDSATELFRACLAVGQEAQ